MVFIHNYVHDGLAAGINPKGAEEVIIRNNIVERVAGYGIAVGFDPYWCAIYSCPQPSLLDVALQLQHTIDNTLLSISRTQCLRKRHDAEAIKPSHRF